MGIFKLAVSYLENLVSFKISEPMTVNISSPGDLRRRFAKFIANISQRHDEYMSLSMLHCLKNMFYINDVYLNCRHWLFTLDNSNWVLSLVTCP